MLTKGLNVGIVLSQSIYCFINGLPSCSQLFFCLFLPLFKNLALGINFAGYGALVGAIETNFHTTRTLAASGLMLFMTGAGT